jgi:hypothetical protein
MDESEAWSAGDFLITAYTSFTLLAGFSGNLFVVVTSHLYQSIEVDSVTIVFIRNLAIADCLFVVNTVLPTLVSVLLRHWVFGEVLCDLTAHFNFLPVLVNVHLVLFLSLFKFLTCLFPIRMREIGAVHAKVITLISYLSSSIELILSIILGKAGMYKFEVYRCLSKIYISHPNLMAWSAALRFGMPLLLIILCNIWILVIVRRRTAQRVQNRALITVAAVSGLFVVSWTPKLVYVTATTITKRQVPWAVAFSHYFPFINSVGNPIIYTFTNRRYGQFVKGLFRELKNMIGQQESTQDTPNTVKSFYVKNNWVVSRPTV